MHAFSELFASDVDECSVNKTVCGPGDCINTLGNFECECEPGFSVKQGDTKCSGIKIMN